MEKIITYMELPAKVACDEKCHKAWGNQERPKIQFDDTDDDDFAYLSDNELGVAPENPGTYEGGQGKPSEKNKIPNKWCVRECERCAMSNINEEHLPLQLPDWSKRSYNQDWKHKYFNGN